jgi:hypothetical protein
MPLKKPEDRGTEKNLENSPMYCKHCYQEGEFIHKEITLEDMRTRVKQKCVEMGIPRWLAGLLTRNMHKLERWKPQ